MTGSGYPSSGRQVSDLTPPRTTNESAPDPTAGERVTTLLHSYDRSTGMCRCGDGPLTPADWVAHYKGQDQPTITTEGGSR